MRQCRHRDATEAEELHALDYLAYSYLQQAEDAKGKEVVDLAATVRKNKSGNGIQRGLRRSRQFLPVTRWNAMIGAARRH